MDVQKEYSKHELVGSVSLCTSRLDTVNANMMLREKRYYCVCICVCVCAH